MKIYIIPFLFIFVLFSFVYVTQTEINEKEKIEREKIINMTDEQKCLYEYGDYYYQYIPGKCVKYFINK